MLKKKGGSKSPKKTPKNALPSSAEAAAEGSGWGQWTALIEADDEATRKASELVQVKRTIRECQTREMRLREMIRSEQSAHEAETMVLLEEATVREEELKGRLAAIKIEIQGLSDADEANTIISRGNDALGDAALKSIDRVFAMEEELRKESDRLCQDKSHHVSLINGEIRKTVTGLKEELEILRDPEKHARTAELGMKMLNPSEMIIVPAKIIDETRDRGGSFRTMAERNVGWELLEGLGNSVAAGSRGGTEKSVEWVVTKLEETNESVRQLELQIRLADESIATQHKKLEVLQASMEETRARSLLLRDHFSRELLHPGTTMFARASKKASRLAGPKATDKGKDKEEEEEYYTMHPSWKPPAEVATANHGKGDGGKTASRGARGAVPGVGVPSGALSDGAARSSREGRFSRAGSGASNVSAASDLRGPATCKSHSNVESKFASGGRLPTGVEYKDGHVLIKDTAEEKQLIHDLLATLEPLPERKPPGKHAAEQEGEKEEEEEAAAAAARPGYRMSRLSGSSGEAPTNRPHSPGGSSISGSAQSTHPHSSRPTSAAPSRPMSAASSTSMAAPASVSQASSRPVSAARERDMEEVNDGAPGGGGMRVKARPWSALEVDRGREESVHSSTWGGQQRDDQQQQQQQQQQQRPASAIGTSSTASSRVPSSRPSSALATVSEAKGADGGQGRGWARPMSAAPKRREPPARPRPPLRIPTGGGDDESLGGTGDNDDEWERNDVDDDDDDDEGLGIEADDSEEGGMGEEDDIFDVGTESLGGKVRDGGRDVAGGDGEIVVDQGLFASSTVAEHGEGAGGASGGGKSKVDDELRVFAEELKALLVGHGLGEHRRKIDALEKLGCMAGAITEHEDRDGVWRSSGSGSRGFMGAQFEANFRRRPPSVPLTERRPAPSKKPLNNSNGGGDKNAASGAYSNIFQAYEKAKIRTVHSSILLRPRPASARPPSAASSIKARGASRPNSALEAR